MTNNNISNYDKWMLINKILNICRELSGKPIRSPNENPYKKE